MQQKNQQQTPHLSGNKRILVEPSINGVLSHPVLAPLLDEYYKKHVFQPILVSYQEICSGRIKALQEEVSEKDSAIDKLRQENASLKSANTAWEQKVEELLSVLTSKEASNQQSTLHVPLKNNEDLVKENEALAKENLHIMSMLKNLAKAYNAACQENSLQRQMLDELSSVKSAGASYTQQQYVAGGSDNQQG